MKNKKRVVLSIVLFLSIMLFCTISGETIRNITSPAIAMMMVSDNLPDAAFIDKDHTIYVVLTRSSVVGQEYYVKAIQADTKNIKEIARKIPGVPQRFSVVIGSDRPVIDGDRVKALGNRQKTIIPSKYRDSLMVRAAGPQMEITSRVIQSSTLIEDVWFESSVKNDANQIIYLKARPGYAEIVQRQVALAFGDMDVVEILNFELEYRKTEFGILLGICLLLFSILILGIRALTRVYRPVKESIRNDLQTYYVWAVLRRNFRGILFLCLFFILTASIACSIFYFMPYPPVPAETIPKKLIYIKEFLENIAAYNAHKVSISMDFTHFNEWNTLSRIQNLVILFFVAYAVVASFTLSVSLFNRKCRMKVGKKVA